MAMSRTEADACRAWQLLMKFFFAQRGHLPVSGAEFDLSPVQCHVLHLIEPGRPLPMGRLADTLHVTVTHAGGLRTSYSFLSTIAVRTGQSVARGDVLGLDAIDAFRASVAGRADVFVLDEAASGKLFLNLGALTNR